MRPRLIASVPGHGEPELTPFQRFEKFARMIVAVPKSEADKMSERAGRRAALQKKPKGV